MRDLSSSSVTVDYLPELLVLLSEAGDFLAQLGVVLKYRKSRCDK